MRVNLIHFAYIKLRNVHEEERGLLLFYYSFGASCISLLHQQSDEIKSCLFEVLLKALKLDPIFSLAPFIKFHSFRALQCPTAAIDKALSLYSCLSAISVTMKI